MTVQDKAPVEIVSQSGIFDLRYYSQQAGQSFSSLEKAIAHYLESGHDRKFNPHPLFNTDFYLTKYPDVAKAGVNALLHYIAQGGIENRNPCEYFDGYFYLSENPDVKVLKTNPLSHFILIGAEQGRRPSAIFDTTFYANENPEVKASNLNPLTHYVIEGKSEGRRPNSRPSYPRDLYLKMRQLEPLLPQFEALQSLRESKESFVSKPGLVYNKLKEKISEPFSHLFVVSNQINSLKNASDFARALKQINLHNRALIILSGASNGDTEATFKKTELANSIISLQSFGKKLEQEEELQVILRLAMQAKPQVIHAFDSSVCLNLFKRLHKPLSLQSKLFASASAFTADSEGIPSGPNLYLSACANNLSAIFVDNESTQRALIDLLGFEPELVERMIVFRNSETILTQLKQLGYFVSQT